MIKIYPNFTVKEKKNVACPVLCVVTRSAWKEYCGVAFCNVKFSRECQ